MGFFQAGPNPIRAAIEKKQNQRSEAIRLGLEKARSGDPENDSQYISASACEITRKIREGEWTALRVMQAFVRSAAEAHRKTNCLTEVMFEEALDAAESMDKELPDMTEEASADKVLLGLPMSLKDENDVKGVDSSIGFVR